MQGNSNGGDQGYDPEASSSNGHSSRDSDSRSNDRDDGYSRGSRDDRHDDDDDYRERSSHRSGGRGFSGRGGERALRCYKCRQLGHFARDCTNTDNSALELPDVGTIWRGEVSAVKDFGIFVQIPKFKKEGLVHLAEVDDNGGIGSQLSSKYFIGDTVWVKVYKHQGDGKYSLSMRSVDQRTGQEKPVTEQQRKPYYNQADRKRPFSDTPPYQQPYMQQQPGQQYPQQQPRIHNEYERPLQRPKLNEYAPSQAGVPPLASQYNYTSPPASQGGYTPSVYQQQPVYSSTSAQDTAGVAPAQQGSALSQQQLAQTQQLLAALLASQQQTPNTQQASQAPVVSQQTGYSQPTQGGYTAPTSTQSTPYSSLASLTAIAAALQPQQQQQQQNQAQPSQYQPHTQSQSHQAPQNLASAPSYYAQPHSTTQPLYTQSPQSAPAQSSSAPSDLGTAYAQLSALLSALPRQQSSQQSQPQAQQGAGQNYTPGAYGQQSQYGSYSH